MTKADVDQWKRTGTIATTIISVAVIASWISAVAWGLATRPILDEIHSESEARKRGDEAIVLQLKMIGRDRLDLIDVMMTAPGKDRDRKLSMIREKWAQDDKLTRRE